MEDTDFTPEQRAIVELGPDARAIVDAPAGTGKTHVLAGRLAMLVERDGLEAGDEVLVMSFSRAAVLELRRRVGALGGDAAYAGSSTFDSFASRLLASETPDGGWLDEGFDDRIRAATLLIAEGELPGSLALVRHLLVDEVQDLVGPRAELVLALADRLPGGFTFFGDPAQAIYGYQDATGAAMTTAQFYSAVEARSHGPLLRMHLERDFRGSLKERDEIASIGAALRAADPDQPAIADRLRSLALRLPLVTVAAAKRMLVRDDAQRSAVLCRTNGEALRISAELFRLGVLHSLQRRGEDKAVGSWLAQAALHVPGTHAQASAVRERQAAADGYPIDELLRNLRRLDPARGDSFDFARMANRIRNGDIPEEVNEAGGLGVVVSTIHRAKGLEFDRVLLCESDRHPDADVGDDNRLRYVAMTRARSELFHLAQVDAAGLQMDRPTGRWVRRGFGKQRWMVREFEVIGQDADSVYPGAGEDAGEVIESQSYMLGGVLPGDAAELVLIDSSRRASARYRILHNGRAVGVTSERFTEHVTRTVGADARLPSRISGLHVEMVDTVAGDTIAGRNAGLGAHGLWARVRVFGLGVLEYDGASRRES